MTKVCKVCNIEKTLDSFHKDKNKPKGVRAECKSCRMSKLTGDGVLAKSHIQNTINWRQKNPNYIIKIREWQLQNPWKVRSYVIKNRFHTTEAYIRLLMDLQKGCCGICGNSLISPESSREYTIDHDHNTGEIRGLLCHGCNTNLERYLHLNTIFSNKAKEYLNVQCKTT